MHSHIINIVYLIASVLFIIGLKGLAHPRTAVRGNFIGAIGMLMATVAVLTDRQIIDYRWIIAGLVVGTGIGAILATRIQMTAMPQMVALLNGLGGGASALVAGAALLETTGLDMAALPGGSTMPQVVIATAASGLIGAVTLTGSYIAFGKLQGIVREDPVRFPGHHAVNAALLIVSLLCGAGIVMNPDAAWLYLLLVVAAGALGVLLVMPIGGADMPVVIALLNSYSGLAAAATGFVLSNNVLIITGSLVGASGIILTQIMCKAMNRSLANVLFGGLGEAAEKPKAGADDYEGRIKATSADEVAMLLDGAGRVVVVPGYGMAVAHAQHPVKQLADELEKRGTTVEYAIHPVAGRMPGHMNVLLAEAEVPYEKLIDMDTINPTFNTVDVALVIGANDVVNPLARTDPKSPIAGMPILDVDKARTVIVVKRSLSPGFAGIPNPLFAADNTLMFFADGKQAVVDLLAAFKEL